MTKIPEEAVEMMRELERDLAANPANKYHRAKASAIVAMLPEPVDPLVLSAREIIADAVRWGEGAASDPERKRARDFLSGDCDQGSFIQSVVKLVQEHRAQQAKLTPTAGPGEDWMLAQGDGWVVDGKPVR